MNIHRQPTSCVFSSFYLASSKTPVSLKIKKAGAASRTSKIKTFNHKKKSTALPSNQGQRNFGRLLYVIYIYPFRRGEGEGEIKATFSLVPRSLFWFFQAGSVSERNTWRKKTKQQKQLYPFFFKWEGWGNGYKKGCCLVVVGTWHLMLMKFLRTTIWQMDGRGCSKSSRIKTNSSFTLVQKRQLVFLFPSRFI